jgi:hypothetical protein
MNLTILMETLPKYYSIFVDKKIRSDPVEFFRILIRPGQKVLEPDSRRRFVKIVEGPLCHSDLSGSFVIALESIAFEAGLLTCYL